MEHHAGRAFHHHVLHVSEGESRARWSGGPCRGSVWKLQATSSARSPACCRRSCASGRSSKVTDSFCRERPRRSAAEMGSSRGLDSSLDGGRADFPQRCPELLPGGAMPTPGSQLPPAHRGAAQDEGIEIVVAVARRSSVISPPFGASGFDIGEVVEAGRQRRRAQNGDRIPAVRPVAPGRQTGSRRAARKQDAQKKEKKKKKKKKKKRGGRGRISFRRRKGGGRG